MTNEGERLAAEILMESDPIFKRFYLAGISFPIAVRLANYFNTLIDGMIAFEEQIQKASEVISKLFVPAADYLTDLMQEIAECDLDPPPTKLQRKFNADRRRADRELARVRFKYMEWRSMIFAQRIYKPP